MFKKNAGAGYTGTIDTLISDGCEIIGNIVNKSSLKIDGKVMGNINAGGTVIIAESGKVEGDILCKELIVFGQIVGKIKVEKLHLQTTARTQGDIDAKILQVEAGATYQGVVNMQNKVENNPTKNIPQTPKKEVK